MRFLVPATIVCLSLLTFQAARSQAPKAAEAPSPDVVAAATYEHLATAIIEIEATEDDLVKSILIGFESAVQVHLRRAAEDAQNRRAHLEAAATQITNIANEGDKRIQAIRQRLSKAGHTHNTDSETKEDYMFINSREKREVLALARRVAQMTPQTSADDIRRAGTDLRALFTRVIAPE